MRLCAPVQATTVFQRPVDDNDSKGVDLHC